MSKWSRTIKSMGQRMFTAIGFETMTVGWNQLFFFSDFEEFRYEMSRFNLMWFVMSFLLTDIWFATHQTKSYSFVPTANNGRKALSQHIRAWRRRFIEIITVSRCHQMTAQRTLTQWNVARHSKSSPHFMPTMHFAYTRTAHTSNEVWHKKPCI